jgi:hypothetical protein
MSDHHVYPIEVPNGPGFYRLRATSEVSNDWTIDQLKSAAIFDAAGRALNCETMRSNSLIGQTTRLIPITGHWLSDDAVAKLLPIEGFDFRSVWSYDLPELADAERPVGLALEWRANAADAPGYVQVLETTSGTKTVKGPSPKVYLADGRNDRTKGQVDLYVSGKQLGDSLRFTLSSEELSIDKATLRTMSTRPWARAATDAPGWIVFAADGPAPYRLQTARTGSSCGGISSNLLPDAVRDPDWPPEATLKTETPNAARLGVVPVKFEQPVQKGIVIPIQSLLPWILWLVLMVLGFFAALLAILATRNS